MYFQKLEKHKETKAKISRSKDIIKIRMEQKETKENTMINNMKCQFFKKDKQNQLLTSQTNQKNKEKTQINKIRNEKRRHCN